MAEQGNLKSLPLEGLHRAAGARFGPFAGWSMPLTYPDGVMKEHLHTRDKVGLFDISHMKLFQLTGADAAEALARACPLDPAELIEGHSKYTFFLNDRAGIIDDLIVTRLGDDRFMMVVNAGNAEADEAHFKAIAAGFDCAIEPLERVILALQGPEAEAVLRKAGPDLSDLVFMRGTEPRKNWFATRSGYTGEDGFEIALPVGEAQGFAQALLADNRVKWIGLAARDSLRLEAGLCLHGQDIDEETTPAEAGLMWAIPRSVREAGAYVGAAYLTGELTKSPQKKRVGLKPEGRQPIRAGTVLFGEGGSEIGYVTSGGFGPSVGMPVAMGYVAMHAAKVGTRLEAEARGKRLPVEVHPLPFTPHRYRKG